MILLEEFQILKDKLQKTFSMASFKPTLQMLNLHVGLTNLNNDPPASLVSAQATNGAWC